MSPLAGVVRRCALTLLGAVAIVAAIPAPSVSAHATILQIVPADGTLLAEAPDTLTVRFSEPIKDDFIEVRFLSTKLDTGPLVGAVDPDDDRVLVVPLPPLADGLHQIAFAVRDKEDLHEVRGRTSFAVGDAAVATPSPPPNPSPQPLETTARWTFALGLALLIGVIVSRSRALVPADDERGVRALVVLSWIAGVAVVLGRVGIIVARALDLDAGLWDGLKEVAGTSDMVRLPITLVALACAMPACMPRHFRSLDATVRASSTITIRTALGWLGVVWLAVLASWGDHAALKGAVEPLIALAKAAHFIGLGLWIGLLLVVLITHWGSGRTSSALAAVSRLAVTGAVVAAASGLLLSSRMVVSLTGLFATTFGKLLAVKLILIAIAAALGLAHRSRYRRAVVVIESLLLVLGVAVLGSAMATAGPATDQAYLPAPGDAVVRTVVVEMEDVVVRAQLIPASPGPNTLEFTVLQTRRPIPGPFTSVTVSAITSSGPQDWTVTPDERGASSVPDVDLPEGDTTFSFSVEREGLPPVDLTLDLTTRTPRYHHPVIVSSQPLVWVLRGGALALALGLVLLPVIRRRRSR